MQKVFFRLRASNHVEEDIEEMRAEERAQQTESSISMMELICSPTLRAPLIIGVVMQLSQQLSGINAVSFHNLFLLMVSWISRKKYSKRSLTPQWYNYSNIYSTILLVNIS